MLFQIAATKSLSIDKGVECSFPNLTQQLNYLNADSEYNPSLKHAFDYTMIFDKLNTEAPSQKLLSVIYPFEYIAYDLPKDNFMVDGFFQSEKYFDHNRKAILEFIKMPVSVFITIRDKYHYLLEKRTTAVHVRRGDFINHPNHHPAQTLDYYLKGIEYLSDITDTFIIFSDDINWCKDNIKGENIVYIQNEKDYVELYLMSLCNNNIISNSSFSWWGAWMNQNENKVVVAPKKWFGPAIEHNTNDIIPENWVKI